MKKILTLLLLASFSFASVSCDDYLDVNKNEDAPDYIKAPLYLSGIQASLENTYYDGRGLVSLAQMMGTTNYTSVATHWSPLTDNGCAMWRTTYCYMGMNLENMVNQALEDGCYPLAGIGMALKAFGWDYITKMHGDIPILQAFIPGLLNHDYDYQNVVFEKVREWANKSLEYLEMEDESGYMNEVEEADIIYGGDVEKWKKFAHAVIVRNLSALTNKNDFASKYAQELLQHAALSMQTTDDDATMAMPGGGNDALFSSYNCCWGVSVGSGTDKYFPSDFAVQTMTGTLPVYNETTGDREDAEPTVWDEEEGEYVVDERYPWKLAETQYVTDTSDVVGHFDPRVTAKIGTLDANNYKNMDNVDSIKSWVYYSGQFTSWTSHRGPTCANLWGSRAGQNSNATYDGTGRWLYRENAPYVFITASEIQFCIAETQWKLGDKAAALAAFKKGIALDLEFTAKYLDPGKPKVEQDADGNDVYKAYGSRPGGDVVSVNTFKKLAAEYQAGPYVEGMTLDNFTLSHIMMQKFVALFPWGACETWVDMRKYHYDVKYSGEYPKLDNGWTLTTLDQKWDTDPTKVYKGLYLAPAQVEYRKGKYDEKNDGSPMYRIRPRYNSEYMWNLNSLKKLKPIPGDADEYHTSIPWFAYPGEIPTSL